MLVRIIGDFDAEPSSTKAVGGGCILSLLRGANALEPSAIKEKEEAPEHSERPKTLWGML